MAFLGFRGLFVYSLLFAWRYFHACLFDSGVIHHVHNCKMIVVVRVSVTNLAASIVISTARLTCTSACESFCDSRS